MVAPLPIMMQLKLFLAGPGAREHICMANYFESVAPAGDGCAAELCRGSLTAVMFWPAAYDALF